MAITDYLPFRRVDNFSNNFVAKSLDSDDLKSLNRVMKVSALALGYQGTTLLYNKRSNFEPSPYNFDRIIQAVDTDSYVKQAIAKYRELFWKEGWEIVGENSEAVEYLYQRIDYMEIAMKRPFLDFLIEVSDQLFKFSNAFIVKARGDINEYFPGNIAPVNANQTLVGYYLIPTEQVRILRNKHNRPQAYQQATDPLTYSPNDKDPVWAADRVIHMHFERKTGRAFGTPFLSNVLDDVVALRQMEEDIQNLVHRELFPLYKYRIGTPEQPAEPDEISQAAAEIENMRTEGGLIIPHRHDIDVVGANGAALDAGGYLDHFKERVAVGLGVAPHHLGMSMNGGNRSVTERLDTALYDKVKQMQKMFSELVRVTIFNELLLEGGFDPVVNPYSDSVSDRCYFKFNEIDVDTQVKKETHVIQKFVNSMITLPEARKELGIDPEYDKDELFTAMQASLQTQMQLDVQSGKDVQRDSEKQTSSNGGSSNLPNNRRGPGNSVRPANQQGRKTSPDIKRSDTRLLSLVENLLEEEYTVIFSSESESE
jgi:hypothetical protein